MLALPIFARIHFFGESFSSFAHQNTGGLRHSFDDQAMRRNRKRRIQIVQMLLGQRDVLNRRRRLLRCELGEFVDPDPTHD